MQARVSENCGRPQLCNTRYLLLTGSLIGDVAYGKVTVPVSLDIAIRNAGSTRLTGYCDGVVHVLAKILVLALKCVLFPVGLNQIILIGGTLKAPGQCVASSGRTAGTGSLG